MCPKNAEGIANSVDPDQNASLGAVWSGSALFAQVYLSENLGSLRYWVKQFFFILMSNNCGGIGLSLSILPPVADYTSR